MPALSVFIDEELVVTVNCDKFDVMSVRVSGTRAEEEFASLVVSGGAYPEAGESTSLTWVNEVPLEPGQTVRVQFLENAASTAPGKTIEELFPGEEPSEEFDFTPTEQMFEELRAKPKQRNGWSFEYQSPEGQRAVANTTPEEHGFGFTVLWNSHRPSRASVSLHSYTIDSLQRREPGNDHAREYLQFSQSVAIRVGA
jgi:hypothetical protein